MTTITAHSELLMNPLESPPVAEPALENNFSQEKTEVEFSAEPSPKNMILKLDLLTKLGMGSKTVKAMTKDDIKKMSFIYESERRESFDEEDLSPDQEVHSSYSNLEGDFSLNFFQKTDDEVRQAYLNRLINMKILRLQPSKKHQEIIILDWDDTLLCTSYLGRYGLVNLPEEILEPVKMLDEKVAALLETVTSYGKTFIITNAQQGWVASTGSHFLPKSYAIIQEKIKTVSARSEYEDEYPEDRYRWKVEAFLDLKRQFSDDIAVNIVCVGDSRVEIDAARCLGEQFDHALVKTVKFKNCPSAQDLVKQISLLQERFEQIITSRTNLTIRLEKKSN